VWSIQIDILLTYLLTDLLWQVTVVEETIRYIDELHKALAAKLQSKTGLIYDILLSAGGR